jgi:Uncharacterized protein conserved in bacteria
VTETPDRLILHRARLAAKQSLDDLALATCIAPALLRAMDNGQFHRLPAGLYARAYVRSVAVALGLDAETTLTELLPLLPGLDSVASAAPVPAAPGAGSSRPAVDPPIPAATAWSGGHDDDWRRFGGSLVDGLGMLALQVLTAGLAAVAAGVGLGQFVQSAWPALIVLWLITSTSYFIVFAGVSGITPGDRLCGVRPPRESPHTGGQVVRRAWAVFLAKSSIVVDLAQRSDVWPGAQAIKSSD